MSQLDMLYDAVKFIEHIMDEPIRGKKVLQTGNLVLDAIVSSKLLLAQSKDIDVTVQVAYPEVVPIEDNDLCAIAGNLMDNAIEACEQIEKLSARRFIDFSILAKGKNIILTIPVNICEWFRTVGTVYDLALVVYARRCFSGAPASYPCHHNAGSMTVKDK